MALLTRKTAPLQQCATATARPSRALRRPQSASIPRQRLVTTTTTCRAAGRLIGGRDVVEDYTEELTSEIHELAEEIKDFVPEKADETLSAHEQATLQAYINRAVDLILMEVDAEVQEFVACLKDWPLKWLQDDGRVLIGLSAIPAGAYYQQDAVRFYLTDDKRSSSKKRNAFTSSDSDEEWAELPRHSMAPGDMVLMTPGKKGPLASGGWSPDMLCGVVIERSRTWIKVAFDTAPDRDELQSEDWRLDKSVNTLTAKRALLAHAALWHRMPLETETWMSRRLTALKLPLGLLRKAAREAPDSLKEDVDEFYKRLGDTLSGDPGQHMGVFEGSALSGVILTADKDFDWRSLPSATGGMPDSAVTRFSSILPEAGRPNEAATAALLRKMEQEGQLGQVAGLITRLDASQMQAIATAVMNPLALLHGPPGTGKTTTIGGLMYFLRRQHGYKGRILATAQSNVAVDNMLETALHRGGLRVLRIGEPAKVRSCLQACTLKVQLAQAMDKDPEITAARREQQDLRRKLRRKSRSQLERWEVREIYKRLDELRELLDVARAKVCTELLESAEVVGVTCTGAAGPELANFSFDMVVIDEGSQASEPEALIPIMKGSQRVVVVGDHKQLPPVIKSREAEAGGLGKSLFERLMELKAPSAMLQVQYRSHPSLMEFINEEFYHSLLSNGVSAAARPAPSGFPFPNPQVPLVFIHVDGRESSSARGSKMNEQEAAVLEGCVRLLVESCGLQPGQLGVITPYATQVALLSKRLQRGGFNVNGSGGSGGWDDEFSLTDLEVRSVDGYQGREKDVILLSTVRANSSQEVGFLEDWRRANVALSRARRALVVVGHRQTLKSSKTWNAFLKHVESRAALLVPLQELPVVIQEGSSNKTKQNTKGNRR